MTMDLSLNVTFSVLPSSRGPVDPVGPTQNKAPKPPFLQRAIDWLRHISHPKRVSDSDSSDKAYEVSNPGGPQPPESNSLGNSNHHSSTTMAPGTNQGFPTPASSPGTSSLTLVQSTGQLAQSHKEDQGSDHGYPRQLSGKKRTRQEEGEEERNLGEKKMEQGKKVKKEPRFSKVKGDF